MKTVFLLPGFLLVVVVGLSILFESDLLRKEATANNVMAVHGSDTEIIAELKSKVDFLAQQFEEQDAKLIEIMQVLQTHQKSTNLPVHSSTDATPAVAKSKEGTDATTATLTPVETPESNHKTLPPRLEFLHIQKNAGTMIEKMAAKANVPWGTCHFDFPWKRNQWSDCPLVTNTQRSPHVYWHYPLQFLEENSGFEMYPYDNHADKEYAARPKKFFAVVRNPYARLISLFYHGTRFSKKDPTKTLMNTNIQHMLNPNRGAWKVGLQYNGSTICQHPYIYDDENETEMVDHVVQFEHLAADFNPLAQQYGLNMTIPETKTNQNKIKTQEQLTVEDFYPETIDLINTICAKDFQLARGYDMIKVEANNGKVDNSHAMNT